MKTIERLENITECLDSKRVPLKEQDRSLRKGDIPYYGANGQVGCIDDYLFDERLLLLSEDGGSWGQGKKCSYLIEGKSWVNNHAHVLRSNGKAELGYLYYYLNHADLNPYITGTTRGKLNRARMNDIKVPLPSLKEQKSMVNNFDRTNLCIQNRKEQLKLLDDYLKSVFVEMFGDPVVNEKNIAQRKIGDVGEVVTGNTPSRQKKEYYGDFIEWIKSDNINTPEFVLTKAEEFLSKIGIEVGRVAPEGAVLVTSIAGSPDCIGNCAISDRDVAFNQQINAFVPGKEIKTEFFFAQLYLCKRLVQQASTESMKGMVSKSHFSDIKVLVPKLNEQVDFVRIFNQISEMCKKMRASLEEMDNHFNALMQRYFRGELHG